MSSRKHLSAALALGALLLVAPAQAAKLGPYFPLPGNFPLTSGNTPRDSLLKIQAKWLQNGLENLEKAQKETAAALEKRKGENAPATDISALEEKLKTLDDDIAATKEEIAIANEEVSDKERQRERKRLLLLNVNQWINELGRQATQELKKAILSDGMEAQIAENRHIQLSELSDAIERAKHDVSIEEWTATR